MHPRISVSAICTATLPFAADLEFWARHGIDRVGAGVAKMEAHGWDAAVDALVAADVGVANLIGPGPFGILDESRWAVEQVRADRYVDAAARLGVETIVLTTGPAGALAWEEAAERFGRALASTIERAGAAGVSLVVEHTNSLRVDVGFLHSLRDALDLARGLGIGVCMEINACWAERGLYETLRTGIDAIRIVQISDFRVGTHSTPDRLVPGDGDIPIKRIVAALLDAGYQGSFDLETIGPRIEAEGYDRAIPRSVAWLTELLERLGA